MAGNENVSAVSPWQTERISSFLDAGASFRHLTIPYLALVSLRANGENIIVSARLTFASPTAVIADKSFESPTVKAIAGRLADPCDRVPGRRALQRRPRHGRSRRGQEGSAAAGGDRLCRGGCRRHAGRAAAGGGAVGAGSLVCLVSCHRDPPLSQLKPGKVGDCWMAPATCSSARL